MMLRWMIPFLVASFALATAAEAVGPAGISAARRAARQLPAGLPRPHYRFRTTIAPAAPTPYASPVFVGDPEVLFTPSDGYVPYLPPAFGIAWLPGYPAWSGYGSPYYDYYLGPWFGGADSGLGNPPYGCGGYGTAPDYGYGWGYGYAYC
jgi:hypothetical protein